MVVEGRVAAAGHRAPNGLIGGRAGGSLVGPPYVASTDPT